MWGKNREGDIGIVFFKIADSNNTSERQISLESKEFTEKNWRTLSLAQW